LSSPDQGSDKKNEFLLVFAKETLSIVFAFVYFRKVYKLLIKVNKEYKTNDKWLDRQANRIKKGAFRATLALFLAYTVIPTTMISFSAYRFDKSKTVFLSNELYDSSKGKPKGLAKKYIDLVDKGNKTAVRFDNYYSLLSSAYKNDPVANMAPTVFLIFFGISIALNLMLLNLFEIRSKTKKFEEALISEGVIKKEDVAKRMLLATPVGFHINCVGMSAKEVASRESLWKRFNTEVGEKNIFECESDNTMVWLKSSYRLESTYNLTPPAKYLAKKV
jgi:hypothetical protein